MQLKILTMNLLYAEAISPAGPWRERLPLVLDILHSEADVIALQEATTPQLQAIDKVFGKDYTLISGPESGESRLSRAFTRLHAILSRRRRRPTRTKLSSEEALIPQTESVVSQEGSGEEVEAEESTVNPGVTETAPEPLESLEARRAEHCALLFRTDRWERLDGGAFWISPKPDVPGSLLPGTMLPRVVNWVRLEERSSGRQATFFNAHLDFLPWAPLRSARILRQVMDAHWNNSPQFLMGDFNAVPRSAAYRYFARTLRKSPHPPLADAWLTANERVGPEGTFHGGTGQVRWTGRLDRILFRPNLKVERVTTITHHRGNTFPSDHFPVCAELTVA